MRQAGLFIPADGLLLVNRRGMEKESYQKNIDGKREQWTSRYGSVMFSLAGREWAWAGMNEAGLVISTMELASGEYPELDDRTPMFDGNWNQYILDSVVSPAYKRISMHSFDYSCDAPKLMLDVNAQLEGDVEEHFVPYDYETSLSVFRTFCARYGIEVSEQGAKDLTGFFEKFECAVPEGSDR